MRHLTQYIEKVRENERVAISRELHDDLGQALTAIKIDMATIRRNVYNVEVVAKINRVSALLNETIKTVQNITSQLRPQIIDDLGIQTAIEWYTDEYTERTGLEVFLNLDPVITISPTASLNIFRIMQESLTNIARHSMATRVDIELNKSGDSIKLRITDNGIGIVESEINSKMSYGILSMKERATATGGTFTINSRDSNGTLIELNLPFE